MVRKYLIRRRYKVPFSSRRLSCRNPASAGEQKLEWNVWVAPGCCFCFVLPTLVFGSVLHDGGACRPAAGRRTRSEMRRAECELARGNRDAGGAVQRQKGCRNREEQSKRTNWKEFLFKTNIYTHVDMKVWTPASLAGCSTVDSHKRQIHQWSFEFSCVHLLTMAQ